MKVRIYDLYTTDCDVLKKLCEKYEVNYSYDDICKVFVFDIDDDVLVLANTNGVTVAIKTDEFCGLTKDYVFIPSDMFYYIEII